MKLTYFYFGKIILAISVSFFTMKAVAEKNASKMTPINMLWVRADSGYNYDVYVFCEKSFIVRETLKVNSEQKIVEIDAENLKKLIFLIGNVGKIKSDTPPFNPPGPQLTLLNFTLNNKIKKVSYFTDITTHHELKKSVKLIKNIFEESKQVNIDEKSLADYLPLNWFEAHSEK
jgi:hypothetical protein